MLFEADWAPGELLVAIALIESWPLPARGLLRKEARAGSPVDTETYTLTVRQPVSVKSPLGSVQRRSSEVGIRFGQTFTATGGTGTYAWSVSSGVLPAGLVLDATKGTITGTPRTSGKFAFAVTATDAEGRSATVSNAITVASPLAIKTLKLPAATVGRRYQARFATVGGVQPMRWRLARGKLPPGVRLLPGLGTVIGTPRRIGTFRLTVEAKDALGAKAQKALVLLVSG